MADTDSGVMNFNSIVLGGRSGGRLGQLQISSKGLMWRNPKVAGARSVSVSKEDMAALHQTPVAGGGFQLSVKQSSGETSKFAGFRASDLETVSSLARREWGVPLEERPVQVSGKNWGEAELEGAQLSFVVGGRPAFAVSCSDVHAVSAPAKNEVTLEFHTEEGTDTVARDQLVELSFYVPPTNEAYPGDEDEPAAKVFEKRLLELADVGPSGGDAVAEFPDVSALIPRGKFDVELYASFMKLIGANDFKIQYESLLRVFLLPKPGGQHTNLVLTLDPPIRKGQTRYHHVVLQMFTEEPVDLQVDLSAEERSKFDRLEESYSGLAPEVFCKVLRALSGTKLTKHGSFVSPNGGFAIRCSYKAEDGYLYPMEKGFFFLPKPPILVSHTEVQEVEFERHGGSLAGASAKLFDLRIALTNGTDYVFHNMQRTEFENLVNFLTAKRVAIANLAQAQAAMAGGGGITLDEDEDHHMHKIAGEGDDDSEEDEDFDAGDEDSSDDEDSEDGSEEEEEEKPKKKAKRAAKPAKGGKKKRAKKDPNAPKKALSAYMIFANEKRDEVKQENPGIAFGEVGKVLGEKWKAMSTEDKAPFEAKAREDKERYAQAMKEYNAKPKEEEEEEEDEDEDEEEASGEESD